MIERAVHDGFPGEIVLADSAYGESNLFRETVRLLGLDYAVGVHAPTKVWCLDKSERRRGEAIGAQELGLALDLRAFRRVTWREGPGGKLSSARRHRRGSCASGAASSLARPLSRDVALVVETNVDVSSIVIVFEVDFLWV